MVPHDSTHPTVLYRVVKLEFFFITSNQFSGTGKRPWVSLWVNCHGKDESCCLATCAVIDTDGCWVLSVPDNWTDIIQPQLQCMGREYRATWYLIGWTDCQLCNTAVSNWNPLLSDQRPCTQTLTWVDNCQSVHAYPLLASLYSHGRDDETLTRWMWRTVQQLRHLNQITVRYSFL